MADDIGPADDIDAIRRVRAAIEQSVADEDADEFGRHLADEVAQVPTGRSVRGRNEIVEQQRRTYEAYDVDEHFTIEQIVVVGDLATEWGTYDITVTDKNTGGSMRGSTLPYLYAYERGEDGTWRVVRMSWKPLA